MPFSFNPTVSAQGTPQAEQTPSSAPLSPPASDDDLSYVPTAPESPILFISQRGSGNITINAYLQLLLFLISALTIISAIVLFVYGFYLKKSIETKKTSLALQEDTFKDYPFAEMQRLSTRISAMNTVLKEYVSIRSPLKLLEDSVEDTAYFDEFSITKEKRTGYTMSFTVVTREYQSLIQQLEALRLTEYTKIAPQPKYEGVLEDTATKDLRVKVSTPVIIQGVFPDDIVFLSSTKEEAISSPVNQEVPQTGATSSSP